MSPGHHGNAGAGLAAVLGLRVEDLDFDTSTIHVRQSVWHSKVQTGTFRYFGYLLVSETYQNIRNLVGAVGIEPTTLRLLQHSRK